MLEVLVLAMTIMQEEAAVFGLQINWSKTKILQVPGRYRLVKLSLQLFPVENAG